MLSDNELTLLLLNNPEIGLEELIDAYAPLVYTVVYGKLSNLNTKEDIEECVSDIFYEIYKKRGEIDLSKGSIKAYLLVIAKRKAIDVFRKTNRQISQSLYMDDMDDLATSGNSNLETVVTDNETKDILIREIKSLGEPDSEIIIRKYYFGQSSKTISKSLKLKVNTIDKKVSRGLNKLKQSLGGVL